MHAIRIPDYIFVPICVCVCVFFLPSPMFAFHLKDKNLFHQFIHSFPIHMIWYCLGSKSFCLRPMCMRKYWILFTRSLLRIFWNWSIKRLTERNQVIVFKMAIVTYFSNMCISNFMSTNKPKMKHVCVCVFMCVSVFLYDPQTFTEIFESDIFHTSAIQIRKMTSNVCNEWIKLKIDHSRFIYTCFQTTVFVKGWRIFCVI